MRFGVDEAGKGPVIGSMFAAAVRGPAHLLPNDVDDSKRLTAAQRESIAATVRDNEAINIGLAEISVERIDGPTDMNTLTVEAHAEAIAAVAAPGDGGVLDAADVSPARFADRVQTELSLDIDLRAEHQADESFVLVGAASIVAKVARDRHVSALSEEFGELGSGYPSDPVTRRFLAAYVEEYDRLPACARSSWSTSQAVLEAAEQSSLAEF